jgi:hypothetical protein
MSLDVGTVSLAIVSGLLELLMQDLQIYVFKSTPEQRLHQRNAACVAAIQTVARAEIPRVLVDMAQPPLAGRHSKPYVYPSIGHGQRLARADIWRSSRGSCLQHISGTA